MSEDKLICSIFSCCRLVRVYKSKWQYAIDIDDNDDELNRDEAEFCNRKANALTSVLFLMDDLFAIQKWIDMQNDYLKQQLVESEFPTQKLDIESLAIKAYLKDSSRQLTRMALVNLLEKVYYQDSHWW